MVPDTLLGTASQNRFRVRYHGRSSSSVCRFLLETQLFQSRHLVALGIDFRAVGQKCPVMTKLRRNQDADDGCFAECLAGFEPVQSLNQHEAALVGSNENGLLLSDVQDASRDLLNQPRIDVLLSLHGNVDLVDWEA